MKNIQKRGFTLIELLVVIAIIGILSSVVLASLSSARNKSKDAAVKSAMASFRSQLELDSNGTSYGATTNYVTGVGSNAGCGFANFNAATVTGIKTNITSNLALATNFVCSTDVSSNTVPANKWAIAAILPSGAGLHCVDSSGDVKTNAAITSVAAITTTQINNGDCN